MMHFCSGQIPAFLLSFQRRRGPYNICGGKQHLKALYGNVMNFTCFLFLVEMRKIHLRKGTCLGCSTFGSSTYLAHIFLHNYQDNTTYIFIKMLETSPGGNFITFCVPVVTKTIRFPYFYRTIEPCRMRVTQKSNFNRMSSNPLFRELTCRSVPQPLVLMS